MERRKYQVETKKTILLTGFRATNLAGSLQLPMVLDSPLSILWQMFCGSLMAINVCQSLPLLLFQGYKQPEKYKHKKVSVDSLKEADI